MEVKGGGVSSSHGGMFHSRKNMISLPAQAAPRGVVHSFTAYASDSKTLPTSPPTLLTPSYLLHASCAACCRVPGEGRGAARKPDNQEAVTSGPR